MNQEIKTNDDYYEAKHEQEMILPRKLERILWPTTIKYLQNRMKDKKYYKLDENIWIELIGCIEYTKKNTAHNLHEYNITIRLNDYTAGLDIVYEGDDDLIDEALENENITIIKNDLQFREYIYYNIYIYIYMYTMIKITDYIKIWSGYYAESNIMVETIPIITLKEYQYQK